MHGRSQARNLDHDLKDLGFGLDLCGLGPEISVLLLQRLLYGRNSQNAEH